MARTETLTPERLRAELVRLEAKYGMTSAEFFERYQAGEMGDSKAVMRWAWLFAVAARSGVLSPSVRV